MATRANPYGITTASRGTPLKYFNHQIFTDCVTAGIAWVRLMILWTSIELQAGVYDPHSLDVLDDAVHACLALGLHVQFPIQQPPAWHLVSTNCNTTGSDGPWFMPDPTSVANFANFLSKRYNGVTNIPVYGPMLIDAFEIGNEEFDNHYSKGAPTTVQGQPCRDPRWFIPCLNAAAPYIRANSPNSLIGMCSLWWHDDTHRQTFMQAMYAGNCKNNFDYANAHIYHGSVLPSVDGTSTQDGTSFTTQINTVYQVMQQNNDTNKLVWITEWGYNTPYTDLQGHAVAGISDAQRVTYYNNGLDTMRTTSQVGVTNIYTMNYTDPAANPATQSFSLTQFNAPHYTQTFYGVQAYITQWPTWVAGGGGGGGSGGGTGTPHVCIILVENHGYDSTSGDTYIVGNANYPKINALRTTYGSATNFYATSHPSLPNYLSLASGSTQGITNDTYNPATTPLAGNTFVDQLAGATPPIPWKHYAENLPSQGYLGGDSGSYVQHHNPWVYFSSVRTNSGQYNNIVDYSNLTTDLTNGTAPPFFLVQPNNTDNGHSGTDTQCDNFVDSLVSTIKASTWYTANNGQIVLWWDETHPDTQTAGIGDASPGGGHVVCVVINAQNSAATWTSNVNHYGLLGTLEDLYGVARLNKAANTVNGSLAQLFATTGGATLSASSTSLAFTGTVGGSDPSSQVITLTNGGGASAPYTTASSQSWLTVTPTSGTITAGNSGTSTISATLAALAAGTYTGKITYTSGAIVIVVTVTFVVSASGGATPLTVYLTNAPSGTLGTANTLYSAGGGAAHTTKTSLLGSATGYGELYAQGNAAGWAASGTLPSVSGHGFLWDVPTLEGNDLVAGTYTLSVKLNTSGAGAGTITSDVLCRITKRTSGGSASLIAIAVLTAQLITVTPTVFSPTFTTGVNTSFATGDKLYVDLFLNVTNNAVAPSQTITLNDLSTETGTLTGLATARLLTPGYQATVGGGGGGGGSGVTALSVYGSSVAASTLATAGKLDSATGGTDAAQASLLGTATGYGEVYGLGNTGAWSAAGSIGAPSGRGWIWDVTTLEGQQIAAGNWTPTFSAFLAGGSLGTTALKVYGTSVAASTVATAGKLATGTGGASARANCLIGTATGYGELYALGNASAWAASGSIGAPSGHGWLLDATTLEGQQIIAGTWTPSVRISHTTAGTVASAIYVRAYKRSSGGTYTLIGTFSITGQSITATSTTFSPAAASESLTTFATGDKLYVDCWLNVTANAIGDASMTIGAALSTSGTVGVTNCMEVDTPGYQATGGGSGSITADLYLRAYVYHAGGTYTLINSWAATGKSLSGTVNSLALLPASLAAVGFNAGDKLYIDLWANVTANTLATATLTLNTSLSTSGTQGVANDLELDTPGYAAAGSSSGGGGGGVGLPSTIYINNVATFTLAGTLLASNAIGRQSMASFVAHTDTTQHFQQYQPVQIYDGNSVLAFNGYIGTVKEIKPGFRPNLNHTITCIDQHWLASKRVIAKVYTNRTAGYIVQDILTNYLAAEGVTAGQIYDGVTPSFTLYPSTTLYPGGNVGLIPSAVFAYSSVAQALDELVKVVSAAGVPYYWQIDQNLQLWFVPYIAVVNPTVIDGTLIDQSASQPVTVTRANPLYRNTQYITGGVAQTLTQTEIKTGDGNASSFTMGYALNSAPTVSINLNGAGYSAQTVGLKGTTGSQWYWAAGDPIIVQDSAGTKLRGPTGTIDLFKAVYVGQYPTVILDTNAAQVSYQAAIDSSTGIVEAVATDATITSSANGLAKASAYLTRYGQQGAQATLYTQAAGYAPGQLVTVNLPAHGLSNAQMLIENVSLSDQHDGNNVWYALTAVLGPYDVGWVNFFSALLAYAQPANSINIGVGASVPLAANFTASVGVSATMAVNVYACPLPGATQYPATTNYPC